MSNDEENTGEERLPDGRLTRRPQDHVESPGAATDEDGLTEAQIQEAERRLQEYERNPVPCSTWEDIKRRLMARRWGDHLSFFPKRSWNWRMRTSGMRRVDPDLAVSFCDR